MKTHKAFTLFELLLVLALLAVTASLALPALSAWHGRIEIDRANGALVELVSEANRRAVHEGRDWVIQTHENPACLTLEPQRHPRANPSVDKTKTKETRILPSSIQIEFIKGQSREEVETIVVNALGKAPSTQILVNFHGQPIQTYEIDRLTGGLRRVK